MGWVSSVFPKSLLRLFLIKFISLWIDCDMTSIRSEIEIIWDFVGMPASERFWHFKIVSMFLMFFLWVFKTQLKLYRFLSLLFLRFLLFRTWTYFFLINIFHFRSILAAFSFDLLGNDRYRFWFFCFSWRSFLIDFQVIKVELFLTFVQIVLLLFWLHLRDPFLGIMLEDRVRFGSSVKGKIKLSDVFIF